MVSLKPFRGTRPHPSSVKQVIAPSTDHLTDEAIKKMHKSKSCNYLKVLKPVPDVPSKTTSPKIKNSKSFNDKDDTIIDPKTLLATERKLSKYYFSYMKKHEIVKQDEKSSYYIYEITSAQGDHVQLGFMALASIQDYLTSKIKVHENIYHSRMQARADQMTNIGTQVGPIYVCYPDNADMKSLLQSFISGSKPDYSFESFDQSFHKLWCIDDPTAVAKMEKQLNSFESLYINDGHHRMGAMSLINQNSSNDNGCKIVDSFMVAAFPAGESKIHDYNRVISDVTLSPNELFEKLNENFTLSEIDNAYRPTKNNEFGMYYQQKWYTLTFIGTVPQTCDDNDILSVLDISIINNFFITPILGITDVNNDDRIKFVAGCHGLTALEKAVDEAPSAGVAFSIFPSQIEEVMNIADHELTMPPKSTWFEPKPLDGLVVYEFGEAIAGTA